MARNRNVLAQEMGGSGGSSGRRNRSRGSSGRQGLSLSGDGRRSEEFRERMHEIAEERPRSSTGQFLPGSVVDGTSSGSTSGNSTSLMSRGSRGGSSSGSGSSGEDFDMSESGSRNRGSSSLRFGKMDHLLDGGHNKFSLGRGETVVEETQLMMCRRMFLE